jgi:thiol:disulfide interchange protein DsbD
MKRVFFLLPLLALWAGNFAKAQVAQPVGDPTSWTYEVSRNGDSYEVAFKVDLKEGWHVWSLEPGDEFLIPPSFEFAKDDNLKLDGGVAERGKVLTVTMEGVDNPVRYFEGSAVFVQKLKLKKPGKIKGEHVYQVCNDHMCLAPVTKQFELEAK